MSSEEYLGDGVYIFFSGCDIKFRAPRDEGDHEIFIDREMYVKLRKLAEERYGWK